ncbi:MAG: type 4a pilus biogenesis protein PilO [Patescibacteria group bacterium]
MDLNTGIKKPRVQKAFLVGTVFPLALLLGTVLLFFFVLYPKYKELPQKRDDIVKLKQKADALEGKIKKLNDLVDFKDVLQENSDLLDAAMPSQAEVPILLTQVQLIATEAGLNIKNLSYSSSSDSGEKSGEVNVLLSADGNFNQVTAFISSVEKAARLIDISTIRLTAIEENKTDELATGKLEISLGLKSPYFFVESKATTEDAITIDLNNSDFAAFMNRLKELRIYKTTVDTTNIGKENPFSK